MLWVYCKMVFLEFIEEYEYLLSKAVFSRLIHMTSFRILVLASDPWR